MKSNERRELYRLMQAGAVEQPSQGTSSIVDNRLYPNRVAIEHMMDWFDDYLSANIHPREAVRAAAEAELFLHGIDPRDTEALVAWNMTLERALFDRDMASRPEEWWEQTETMYRDEGWQIASYSPPGGGYTIYCAYQGNDLLSPTKSGQDWHNTQRDCWLWLWVNDGNWELPTSASGA